MSSNLSPEELERICAETCNETVEQHRRYEAAANEAAARRRKQKLKRWSRYRLTKSARAALGCVSPELAMLQLRTQVGSAVDDQWAEAEAFAKRMRLWFSVDDVVVVLAESNPVRTLNRLCHINPSLPLTNIMGLEPMTVLKAVVRMLTQWEDKPSEAESD